MSRRLREDRDTLAEHLESLQELTGLPYAQLEKDFWLTEALRGVTQVAAELDVPVYFKGGTSLSKVYGIIERFSEDVDVLVALPANWTGGRRHTVLRKLCAGAEQATGLEGKPDGSKSSKGEKRAVYLSYRLEDDEGLSLGGLREEGVLVELGRWGGMIPNERHQVVSLLAGHRAELGIDEFEEQSPVDSCVITPERTAVEKLMLLHAAASADEKRRAEVARHYYDVWCLLRDATVADQLRGPGRVFELAHDVHVHSEHKDLPSDERPVGGFRTSPAFDPGNPELGVTRDAYEQTVLGQLVWPGAQRPTFEECCEAVTGFGGTL